MKRWPRSLRSLLAAPLVLGALVAAGPWAFAGSFAAGASPSAVSRQAPAPSPAASRPTAWILAYAHFDQVVGAAGVAAKLKHATVYEVVNLRQKPSTLLPVVATLDFHSYARMRGVLSGPLPGYIRAVIYDNERYANTPADEQAHPAAYTRLAVALAHAHHLKIICDDILPDRVPGGVVADCDVVGLNTVQQSERRVAVYRAKVSRLVAVIHAARPGVPITAGLSSNPVGPPVHASVLAQDMDAVEGLVNGFWLNVPAPGVGCPRCGLPRPQVMARALSEWEPSAAGVAGPGARLGAIAWIMAASGLSKLDAADQAWFERRARVAVLEPGSAPRGPEGAFRPWADATSLAAVKRIVGRSRAGGGFAAILLDIERWRFTPSGEAAHPVQTALQAASAAHRAGLGLVVAPALDLAHGTRSPVQTLLGADLYGRLARVADGVEVQAQGLERDPSAYRSFVLAAVAQMRSAHPGIPVWAGLSTNPTSGVPTLAMLLADIRAVDGVVQGFWLNVPAPGPFCPRCHASDPALADALLHVFGAPAPGSSGAG